LVSIITPAWNVSEFIGETVESVLAQSCTDWELIIVNDGSTDSDRLEEVLAPNRSRITYLVQPNGGAAAARNAGLAVARGEYVAFLDGDDVWLPGYLDAQLNFLRAHALDMVYADAEFIGDTGYRDRTFMDLAPSHGPVTVEALLAGRCSVITSGTVARLETIRAVGGFEKRRSRAEDFDLWLRIAQSGALIGYQREVLLRYRVRPGNLTGNTLQRTERGIEALTNARALPLRERERQVLERRLTRQHLELELENAKRMLLAGDHAGARRRLWSVVARHPHPRLLAILLGMYLAPGFLQRRLARQGGR
jgi:glycosyltransferase involved in cell wall biosynthesis